MTDLQCPATVLLVTDARSTERERLGGVFRTPSIASEAIDVLAEAVDVAGLRGAIDHLADLHRGETITVVATLDEIHALLRGTPAPPIRISIDASGWSISSSR